MGPKHLQCALGKGPILRLNPQSYLPADVEVSPRFGLGVAELAVGLQQEAVASRLGGTLSRPLSAK